MKTYYALWIPIRKQTVLSPRYPLKRKKLCDKKSLGGYVLSADFKGDNIHLTYRSCSRFRKGERHTLTLKCEEKNPRGFIIYSFDNEGLTRDGFIDALTGKMNPSVYHYIKGAFHKHQHHGENEDALLQAMATLTPLSFKQNGEEITLHYLQQYKDKFADFLSMSADEFSVAKKRVNSRFSIGRGIDALADIIDKGNSIKGEVEFYRFLLESAREKTWISKDFRTSVEKCIKEIDILLRDVSTCYNLCTSGLGVKYGRWGIWFGLAGIVVSAGGIFYSALVDPDPSPVNNHIDSVRTEIKNTIMQEKKSIADSLTNINDAVKSLDKKIKAIGK